MLSTIAIAIPNGLVTDDGTRYCAKSGNLASGSTAISYRHSLPVRLSPGGCSF